MSTVAVDMDVLNELFDNQKKLDDVLNSLFDEDPFLSSPKSSSNNAYGVSSQMDSLDEGDIFSSEDFSYDDYEDYSADKKSRNIMFYGAVAVEIAAITYGILHFTWLLRVGLSLLQKSFQIRCTVLSGTPNNWRRNNIYDSHLTHWLQISIIPWIQDQR